MTEMTEDETGVEWEFTYNADGMRTQRTDGTNTYTYVYNGSQLVQMTKGSDTLYFTYDASGIPVSVVHDNGTTTATYYYVTNLQGDVLHIFNNSNTTVGGYTYDAWGNPISTGTSAICRLNPLRYRGYVYDSETGLYYLQSRYYNPQIGRFLNADGFVATGQGILSNNMFAYCGNNPVNRADPTGCCYYDAYGRWRHDNWEFIGGYVRKPDPRIAEKQKQLEDMGFNNVTTASATSYVNTLNQNGIDTIEEEAHFLAQCAFESGLGVWLTEYGSEEYFATKAYGYKYRGAGYIQLTWDYNYRDFAAAIGDDEIYNQGADYVAAHYAWQAAGWFWTNNGINQMIANGASVKDITRVVRGSSTTWEQRQAYYDLFVGLLG